MKKKDLIAEIDRLNADINFLVFDPKSKEAKEIKKKVKSFYAPFTPILRFDNRPINESIYKLTK